MEDVVVDLEGSRKSLPSLRDISQKQQPGQYLCVDTTKEVPTVEVVSHQFTRKLAKKGLHCCCNEEQLKAVQDSEVQPDSLCKLKTSLAINYIKDILETNQSISVQKISSKSLKKGHLKPLLVVNQLIEPPITRCLGIQNDRRKKTIFLGHGIQFPVEVVSPARTRFSSAKKARLQKDKVSNVDLRRLSLVDQNSIGMDDKVFSENAEGELVTCDQHQGGDFEIDHFTSGHQMIEQVSEDCHDVTLHPDNYDHVPDDLPGGLGSAVDVDHKLDFNGHRNFKNGGTEFPCIYKDSNHSNLANNHEELYQKVHLLKTDKSFAACTSTNRRTLSTMRNAMQPHTTLSKPELESIQVKDIWKALTDSGFDISRGEVSRYKVNTANAPRRTKSAPVKQRNSQTCCNSSKVDHVWSAYGSPPGCSVKGSSLTNEFSQKYDVSYEEYIADGNINVASNEPKTESSAFAKENSREESIKGNPDLCRRGTLEVVALSKPYSKLPRPKNIGKSINKAPLNFKLNTRPKSGCFFYFAYGLNMNHQRLEIQLRHKIGERYWGLLFGFRLIFNKKGSSEGSVGFPNIVAESGFSVEGCVYELPKDCLQLLDTCTGFPKHYARLVLPVWMCNSLNPNDLGVAQHCVPAVVYVAQDDWVVTEPNMLDCSFTFKQCLIGTDLLTPNYQEFLSLLKKK